MSSPTGANTGLVQITCSINGYSAIQQINLTGTNEVTPGAAVPAAIPGTLTTRTSDTQGIVTTTANHGLAGTETLGLFWATGAVLGCTINSITANTITFTTGTFAIGGDAVLPAGPAGSTAGTSMNAAVAQTITDVLIPHTTVIVVQVTATVAGGIKFLATGGASQLATQVSTTAPYIWPLTVAAEASPPFGSDVTSIQVYGNSLAAGQVVCRALLE